MTFIPLDTKIAHCSTKIRKYLYLLYLQLLVWVIVLEFFWRRRYGKIIDQSRKRLDVRPNWKFVNSTWFLTTSHYHKTIYTNIRYSSHRSHNYYCFCHIALWRRSAIYPEKLPRNFSASALYFCLDFQIILQEDEIKQNNKPYDQSEKSIRN